MTNGTDLKESAKSTDETDNPRTLNGWSVLIILVVMAALPFVIWKVVGEYGGKDAAAVLGIVVPAFVTVGAGVVGIGAYQKGSTDGKAKARE